MSEFLPILLVVAVGLALAVLQASRFSPQESNWILASFGAHVIASALQVWFTHAQYGSGDMTSYARIGEMLATAMRLDPGQNVPEVAMLLFQQPAQLPVEDEIMGPGTSTGSMCAITGFFCFITGGAIYTASAVVGIGAHFGKVAIYRAFKSAFPDAPPQRLLFSALLVPSAVFWPAALTKEGVAMLGYGYAVWGIERLVRGSPVGAAVRIGLGSVLVGLFKPYILVGLLAGTTAYLAFNSPKSRDLLSRPLNILGGALVSVAGSAIILRLFPHFTPDAIASQAAHLQEVGQISGGGSTYMMGDPTKTSLAGQLAFAPVALVTSLFRPFIFEARSAQVFVNSLETTVIVVLFGRLFWKRRFAGLMQDVREKPMMVFALVFMLVFGVGVGLATTNLGTLSRYRVPLVPFLWVFVLVLGDPLRARGAVTQPVRRVLARPRVHARAPAHAMANARPLPYGVPAGGAAPSNDS